MKKRSLVVLAFLVVATVLFGADPAPQPTAAPYSLEALTGQLSMLQFGARNNPAIAITHDQAQKLLPILKKWQATPVLGPTEAKDLFNQAQAVLTAEQKAFKLAPRADAGARGASVPRQGAGQTLSYQDRMAQALDRLIQRLERQ